MSPLWKPGFSLVGLELEHPFGVPEEATCHAGDRKRGRVGEQEGIRPDGLLQLPEYVAFGFLVLEDGLDGGVAPPELRGIGGAPDQTGDFRCLAWLKPASRLLPIKVPAHPVEGCGHPVGGKIADEDRDAELVRDQKAELTRHETGADDAEGFNSFRPPGLSADTGTGSAVERVSDI